MRIIGLTALAGLVSWSGVASAGGADCGCDHEIAAGTQAVNGTALGVKPGETVCIMAGQYEFIRFTEIRGEEGNRVTIKNCGGAVEVRNLDRAYGIDFQGSSHHFHLTGTGDPATPYGFRVSAPVRDPYPGIGLWFLDKSTDYEADHVEVYETGFAGVVAKTDPLCDGSADQGVFVQKNVHLHHMWVHDTGGEGFYVGSTQSDGQTITCNNAMEVRQPHFLEGIEIDHMLIEDTEWDGMQVGMAHEDCSVHDNVIRRVGTARVEFQQQGYQNGTYSKCDFRRNLLTDGPQMGIIVLGSYDSTFADNIIMRFGEDGIYANLNMTPGPVAYRMVHNTIGNYGGAAIRLFGDEVEGAVAWNNFILGTENAIAASNEVGFSEEGNVFVMSFGDAGFVDPDGDDFHLTNRSPARGAGIDHTGDGFDIDLEGKLRAKPPSAGALEHTEDSPSTVSAGGGGGGLPSGGQGPAGGASAGGGGDAAGDDEGCGCRLVGVTSSASASTWLGVGLVFAAIARRRRNQNRSTFTIG